MQRVKILIFFGISLAFRQVAGQLSNSTFRMAPKAPETTYGFSAEVLQYLKNNEYFNNLNPGETLFGAQLKVLGHYRISDVASIQAGVLMQKDFGDAKPLSKTIPILNIDFHKNNWQLNLGNIRPHVNHNLIEPMMSYENIILQPVELGFQAVKNVDGKLFYDGWLNWRQKLDKEDGKQEMLLFGQSLEYKWFRLGKIIITNPLQASIFHRGGQALENSNIATRVNVAAGLRAKTDSGFALETFYLKSIDNSPQLTQPFHNGWASMTNFRFRLNRHHEFALTWWYARQFQSTMGNPTFNNVNYSDVYLNRNTRRLAMVRYVFSRPIFNTNIWLDFRIEPYYDMEYKKTEFSNGLYFRYVGTLDIAIPKWLRF